MSTSRFRHVKTVLVKKDDHTIALFRHGSVFRGVDHSFYERTPANKYMIFCENEDYEPILHDNCTKKCPEYADCHTREFDLEELAEYVDSCRENGYTVEYICA